MASTISSTSSTSGSVSSPGITSGLDVESIVTSLMSLQKGPLTALQNKQSDNKTLISAFGQYKSAIAAIQTAAQNLGNVINSNQILGVSAAVSDKSIASATLINPTAGGSSNGVAGAGTYSLTVSRLATGQKILGGGVADPSAKVGAGAGSTLTIQLGTLAGGSIDANGKIAGATAFDAAGDPKTITVGGDGSLNDIRDAINASNSGVSASIVFDGSTYHLSLRSTDTGEATAFSVSSDDSTINGLIGFDPLDTSKQNATASALAGNLSATVDGMAVSSAKNSIDNAIPGVTLGINGVTTGAGATVTVTRDTNSAAAVLASLVQAWNSYVTLNQTATKYDSSTDTAGILNGDSATNSAYNSFRALLGSPVAGAASPYTTLASIGLSIDKSGKMSLDTTKLGKAMADNPNAVAQLFMSPDKAGGVGGDLGSKISKLADSILGTGDAAKNTTTTTGLTGRIDSLTAANKQLDTQIANMQTRLDARQALLYKQYQSLDSLLSTMNSTSSFLTAQIKSMQNSNSNN